MGLQKWIDLQLTPARIDNSALDAKLQRLETLTLDSRTIQRDYSGPAMIERRKRAAESADTRATEGTESPDPGPDRMIRGPVNEVQRKGRLVISESRRSQAPASRVQ